MNAFWDWYFDKCRLSHLLLGGTLVWASLAWLLLKELAPVAYVGLHAATTGVFLLAVLSADRNAHASGSRDPRDE